MANAIILLGKSGTGKSSSIKGLDPKSTVILNVLGKKLPFKGSRYRWSDKAFILKDSRNRRRCHRRGCPDVSCSRRSRNPRYIGF